LYEVGHKTLTQSSRMAHSVCR